MTPYYVHIEARGTQMYKVFYTNFDYFSQDQFLTVGAAVAYGKSKGFEFQVYDQKDNLIASWRQFGGLRYW